MALNLETPLGMASFLANASHGQKVFVPSTFNMSKIMKNLKLTKADTLICDAEFYGLEPPADQVESLKELTGGVKNVVVGATDGASASSSVLFGGASTVDAYTLRAI